MKKTFISFLILLLTSSYSFCQSIDGIECGRAIDTFKDLELEYMDPLMYHKWAKVKEPADSFKGVTFAKESLLFKGNKFSGKVYSFSGQENLEKLLRILHEKSYEKHDETGVYNITEFFYKKHDDKSWVFINPDEVIWYKRYSVHLGLALLYCRDIYEKEQEQLRKERN